MIVIKIIVVAQMCSYLTHHTRTSITPTAYTNHTRTSITPMAYNFLEDEREEIFSSKLHFLTVEVVMYCSTCSQIGFKEAGQRLHSCYCTMKC